MLTLLGLSAHKANSLEEIHKKSLDSIWCSSVHPSRIARERLTATTHRHFSLQKMKKPTQLCWAPCPPYAEINDNPTTNTPSLSIRNQSTRNTNSYEKVMRSVAVHQPQGQGGRWFFFPFFLHLKKYSLRTRMRNRWGEYQKIPTAIQGGQQQKQQRQLLLLHRQRSRRHRTTTTRPVGWRRINGASWVLLIQILAHGGKKNTHDEGGCTVWERWRPRRKNERTNQRIEDRQR